METEKKILMIAELSDGDFHITYVSPDMRPGDVDRLKTGEGVSVSQERIVLFEK